MSSEPSDESVEDSADAARIAEFRAKLVAGGLDSVATAGPEVSAYWARPVERVERGCVLLGAESFFFGKGGGNRRVREAALDRVGLPRDIANRVAEEQRPSLMPVVLVLDASDAQAGVLLGRRSGFIMGDLKSLDSSQFLVQPLWVGGPSEPPRTDLNLRTVGGPNPGDITGILALHPYRDIDGAQPVTADGLYSGGDWADAKDRVARGRANPFRFRLVAQATLWKPGDLDAELKAGAWTVAQVSIDLLLKDRLPGSRPLWVDINAQLPS